MRFKILVFLICFLAVAAAVSAQKLDSGSTDWSIKCVDGLKKGVEIPCEGLSGTNGHYRITRDLLINTDMKTSRVVLTFTRLVGDDGRFLKIKSVTPERDESDEYQDYWFRGHTQGFNGPEQNLVFVTLFMNAHNTKNQKNGNSGYVSPGSYTGKMVFEDDKTGEEFSIEMTVNVRRND